MKEAQPAKAQKPIRLRMNKRLYIILVCFFISLVFWLLSALSHEYPATIVYPVEYRNLPGRKVVMNELPSKIAVELRTTGFRIISLGFRKRTDPVKVDVSSNMKNTSFSNDILALPTATFMTDFTRELGNDVRISGFVPDSIVFNFSDLTTRKVPVVLQYRATFGKQYDSTGAPELTPPEIEVSGPPSVVAKLSKIYTENIVLEDLKGSATGKVSLIPNKLLTYSVSEVTYKIPVEKFTEGSVVINVNPVSVPVGYSLKTFPDKVTVRYQVALSRYNDINAAMFDAVVDAAGLENKTMKKLDVKLVTFPSFVKSTIVEPSKVDYILRKQ